MNNGLFLPLEVLKREYIGKLLLGAEMAARGMPVYIGHKRRVIDLALQARSPGVLFYKDAAKDLPFAADLRTRGFGLVVQDEEAGVVFGNYGDFYATRSSLDNIPNLSRFLCWGQDDFEFLANRFCDGGGCNVVATGSVKTVLWGAPGRVYFEEAIERIRRRYAKYVLFVTNFKVGNSYLPPDQFLELRRRGAVVTSPYEVARDKEERLMGLVHRAARAIAHKTDYHVVIRPHPVENIRKWKELCRDDSRVNVEPDGDLTPWILAADGVLQNACTSGLQAAASGVPVIAFGEKEADLEDMRNVPNRLSKSGIGVDEIVSIVADLPSVPETAPDAGSELVERKLLDAGTMGPLQRTADAILDVSGPPDSQGNRGLGKDSLIYDLKECYRMWPFRKRTMSIVLDQQKRPTIWKRALEADLNRSLKLLGHDAVLDVSRVGPNCYCIRNVG